MMRLLPAHLTHLTDEYLQEALLSPGNIPPLERLIERERRRLVGIERKMAGIKEERKRIPPARKLSELLQEVREQVDSFLRVTYSSPCPIYYEGFSFQRSHLAVKLAALTGVAAGSMGFVHFSEKNGPLEIIGSYALFWAIFFGSVYRSQHQADSVMRQLGLSPPYYLSGDIVLQREPRASLLPSIAHEYAHHLQAQQLLGGREFGIFKEGHARGVERHISYHYARLEKNPGFLRTIVAETVTELEETYRWICSTLKLKPGLEFSSNQFQSERVGNHALGNTLFYLQEKRLGERMYGDVLEGREVFAVS